MTTEKKINTLLAQEKSQMKENSYQQEDKSIIRQEVSVVDFTLFSPFNPMD